MTSPMQFPKFLCLQMIPLFLLPPHLTPPCTPKFRPVSTTLFTGWALGTLSQMWPKPSSSFSPSHRSSVHLPLSGWSRPPYLCSAPPQTPWHCHRFRHLLVSPCWSCVVQSMPICRHYCQVTHLSHLPQNCRINFYKSYIRPLFTYGFPAWSTINCLSRVVRLSIYPFLFRSVKST